MPPSLRKKNPRMGMITTYTRFLATARNLTPSCGSSETRSLDRLASSTRTLSATCAWSDPAGGCQPATAAGNVFSREVACSTTREPI